MRSLQNSKCEMDFKNDDERRSWLKIKIFTFTSFSKLYTIYYRVSHVVRWLKNDQAGKRLYLSNVPKAVWWSPYSLALRLLAHTLSEPACPGSFRSWEKSGICAAAHLKNANRLKIQKKRAYTWGVGVELIHGCFKRKTALVKIKVSNSACNQFLIRGIFWSKSILSYI
jgi:hypothetical protein